MQLVGARGNVNRRDVISRLIRAVYQPPLEREREFYRRLRDLSDVIDEAPDSMTHVVLRGELYLKRGEYERAQTDFETAVVLSEYMDDRRDWNVVGQVMRDRALFGIRAVERRL